MSVQREQEQWKGTIETTGVLTENHGNNRGLFKVLGGGLLLGWGKGVAVMSSKSRRISTEMDIGTNQNMETNQGLDDLKIASLSREIGGAYA